MKDRFLLTIENNLKLIGKYLLLTLNSLTASFCRLSELNVVRGKFAGSFEYSICGCLQRIQSEIICEKYESHNNQRIVKYLIGCTYFNSIRHVPFLIKQNIKKD